MGQRDQCSSNRSPTTDSCYNGETTAPFPPNVSALESKPFLHPALLKELEFLSFAFMFPFPVFVLGLTAAFQSRV